MGFLATERGRMAILLPKQIEVLAHFGSHAFLIFLCPSDPGSAGRLEREITHLQSVAEILVGRKWRSPLEARDCKVIRLDAFFDSEERKYFITPQKRPYWRSRRTNQKAQEEVIHEHPVLKRKQDLRREKSAEG